MSDPRPPKIFPNSVRRYYNSDSRRYDMRVPLHERDPSSAPSTPPTRGRPPIHDTPLARLCIEMGVSQRALAEATGINVRQIIFYWAGDRKMSQATIAKIADYLGVSPRKLQTPQF